MVVDGKCDDAPRRFNERRTILALAFEVGVRQNGTCRHRPTTLLPNFASSSKASNP
jgi:hypothetical protein